MTEGEKKRKSPYPLAKTISQAPLDAEAGQLDRLSRQSILGRKPGYLKLGGPGFIGAATTLGAGTLTAAMLSGAQFGYKTLWISWVAIGSGLFMMAAMARFTTRGQFRIVQEQRKQHGTFIAVIMTSLVGMVAVAVIFNFGQVALGTHLVETLSLIHI